MKRKIMGFVTLLLFFASVTVSADQVRQATLTSFTGEVMMRESGGEWKPAISGATLNVNDEVKTSDGASAEIVLDNGSVKIREKSHFKIDTLDLDASTGEKVTYLNLALGKILVQVQKLQGNSKFEVRTPTSTTGVRGTVFEVSVE